MAFVPGLALTAALTGAALWAGSFPAIAGARASSALTRYPVRDGRRQHGLPENLAAPATAG
ncbi:hypothetical protein LNP74_17925 [Klebsiella pneumoniae subsp. pneumoniae]|nr:hypothetical protein [Klebsiella pneumoniae subsp. pneumoniae]